MGRWDRTEVDIGTLVGKKLIDVQGCEEGSDEIDLDRDSYGGCESCDYGSSYTVTLDVG